MNKRNSGKRVRLLQKPLVIAGIIVGLVLMLVAAIAIPYFLRQRAEPKHEGYRPRLEPYYIDPNWYPAAGTVEESADTESTDSLPISPREAKE